MELQELLITKEMGLKEYFVAKEINDGFSMDELDVFSFEEQNY